MTHWAIVSLVIACSIAALAWALSPKARAPVLALVLSLFLMAGSYAAVIDVIGSPKPLALEWRAMAGLEIAGITPSEDGKTLYVWVMRGGVPVSYMLPMPSGSSQQEIADILDHWRRRQQTGERFFMGDNQNDSDGPHMKIRQPPPQPPK